MELSQLILPYEIFMAVTLILVLWKGGLPERCGVAAIVAMAVDQLTMEQFIPSRFTSVDVASLGADLIGFVAFGSLALYARRIWPLSAAALQVLCLSAHFARWASFSVSQEAYALIRGVPTALILVLMLGATALCIISRKRGQRDLPWQDWVSLAHKRAERDGGQE
jgi:hypothetical protein